MVAEQELVVDVALKEAIEGKLDMRGDLNVGSIGANLSGSTLDFKFANKLELVFAHWQEIVEAKTKGFTKLAKNSKKYEAQRCKAFGGAAPQREHKVNLFLANFEALYGELVDRFNLLDPYQKQEVINMAKPIKFLLQGTSALKNNIFPKESDNEDFKMLFVETDFTNLRN